MELNRLGVRKPRSGLHFVWSWRYLAACEILPERETILVYAVCKRRDLEEQLAQRSA